MKIGDLVKFDNDCRQPTPFFVVYKTYRDNRVDVVFLVNEKGKMGAFSAKKLLPVSQAREQIHE
jgi:hypothetical protein